MAKERFLTVMVPISDSDCEATVYASIAALQSVVPASAANKDKIYRIADGTYCRSVIGAGSLYSYVTVTDREFPRLGNPLEIYDFTYDATRMGTAPTISAQGVMRYADKDGGGLDVTLDGLWSFDCFVVFNGEKLHLRRFPNSSKSNEDARYKYDIEFISDRVVLENTYFYDVVSPFITEKPVSESSVFSFFGDINELAKRINASLIRSGLASLTRKYVAYPNRTEIVPYLKYEQWTQVNVDPLPLVGAVFANIGELNYFRATIFTALSGDYNRYLTQYIFENDNGDFITTGYKVVIGKDRKGNVSSSEEKLLSFENDTVHDALQAFHDVFGFDYYVMAERDQQGVLTGNTLITVGDCEHDFGDWDEAAMDYVRGDDGVPVSTSPFDYGATAELLRKEKDAKNEKIVTRITGVGSSDNLPWHYPNPTPDGWIKPIYKTSGDYDDDSVVFDYPTSEGDTTETIGRYERYLKNRIGNKFSYGILKDSIYKDRYKSSFFDYFQMAGSTAVRIELLYSVNTNSITYPKMQLDLLYGYVTRLQAELSVGGIQNGYYNSEASYPHPTPFQSLFIDNDGSNICPLSSGVSYDFKLTFDILEMSFPLSSWSDYQGYKYVNTLVTNAVDTSRFPYVDYMGYTHVLGQKKNARIGENFYSLPNLIACAKFIERTSPLPQDKVVAHDFIPIKAGYSVNGNADNILAPITRRKGKRYKDIVSGTIYMCETNDSTDIITGEPVGVFTANPKMELEEWVWSVLKMNIRVYSDYGWWLGSRQVQLHDYGIDGITKNGQEYNPSLFDTIEFRRVKYVTPQHNLMPEVYIKTDGERRFYNAHNYYPLQQGTPDTAIGEENKQGTTDIVNPIYKEKDTDSDDKHYYFENEYIKHLPHEHVENLEYIKPTIEGQTVIVGGVELRIDVVEEFGYDLTDNDEIWENNDNDTKTGEYKHPYFFAKLRPMGFNIFDLALQEDMVVSMTTGDCGACNFRIGVDEKTRKNPVQLWEYDVYGGATFEGRGERIYKVGELRRYVNTDVLYYDTDQTPSGYIKVSSYMASQGIGGGVADNQQEYADVMFSNYTYSQSQVEAGEVGSTRQNGLYHFEGDVVTQGRYMDIQQDTAENSVWVALMKDTETYGAIMPAARPKYDEHQLDVYIRPKSVADVHTSQSTASEDEENADKFTFINISMPQAYLRRAERKLSRELVKYMQEHNAHKYNLPMDFSRIFLEEDQEVNDNINENSVVYVLFDRKVYRQYVRHYTYRMSRQVPLPEITIDTNEELPVTMNALQRQRKTEKRNSMSVAHNFNVVNQKIREVSNSSNTYVSGGDTNIIEQKIQWGEF